ncbi:hypothetical protein FOA52_004771 [Chlamydomonas sp. UWO 241]|nr:hypothetical protein FOA52_004771 [Chlamydomonas sp. UWO 241]
MSYLWTFGAVPELDSSKLHEVVRAVEEGSSKATIIDVRTLDEYTAGHIANSVNASFLPPWGFEDRVRPIIKDLPKNAEMFVICLSAHRSIGALKWLRKEGYGNVKQLQGGMKAWRDMKLPEVQR